MKNNRIFALVMILVAAMILMALPVSADEPVTIKLMMSQTQQPGVSVAVEAFNKAFEGKIICEADYLAFDNVFETLEILMSSKSAEYDV